VRFFAHVYMTRGRGVGPPQRCSAERHWSGAVSVIAADGAAACERTLRSVHRGIVRRRDLRCHLFERPRRQPGQAPRHCEAAKRVVELERHAAHLGQASPKWPITALPPPTRSRPKRSSSLPRRSLVARASCSGSYLRWISARRRRISGAPIGPLDRVIHAGGA
jgi:hypothetical protein